MAHADGQRFKEQLYELSKQNPAINHPWFQDIIHARLTREQIIEGEKQHYLRVRRSSEILGDIVIAAEKEGDYETYNIARRNFGEEVCGEKSHSDIMYQLLEGEGISREDADKTPTMPGTALAIDLLTSTKKHLPATVQMAMLALPELQKRGVNGTAYALHEALTGHYGFSQRAVETYNVHIGADDVHTTRQINRLVEIVCEHPSFADKLFTAARHGLNVFGMGWDGHYQATTGNRSFTWRKE